MEVSDFKINGLKLIKPAVFNDSRGYFFESYSKEKYNQLFEENIEFIQDNVSRSAKHVLRGLHFQKPPFAQGKLVSVLKGKVLDVAVDLRKSSPTYGQYELVELSEENKLQFWIPAGFAHGFLALEDDTVFSYKCSAPYSKESEATILWNDPLINIDWKINNPIISDKDLVGLKFNNFISPFE